MTETTEKLHKAFSIIGGVPRGISNMFEGMKIVEEEIQAGQKRWPQKADLIYDMYLTLGEEHQGFPARNELFRIHCRELIDFAAQRKSLNNATGIDIILAISDASLRTPLIASAERAMFQIWHKYIGNIPSVEGVEESNFETIDSKLAFVTTQDATDEVIRQAQRGILSRAKRQEFFDNYLKERKAEQLKLF